MTLGRDGSAWVTDASEVMRKAGTDSRSPSVNSGGASDGGLIPRYPCSGGGNEKACATRTAEDTGPRNSSAGRGRDSLAAAEDAPVTGMGGGDLGAEPVPGCLRCGCPCVRGNVPPSCFCPSMAGVAPAPGPPVPLNYSNLTRRQGRTTPRMTRTSSGPAELVMERRPEAATDQLL